MRTNLQPQTKQNPTIVKTFDNILKNLVKHHGVENGQDAQIHFMHEAARNPDLATTVFVHMGDAINSGQDIKMVNRIYLNEINLISI
jgi:hypothetical protein